MIHLAALQVPFCKAYPVAGAKANVVGTVNVLEAARHQGLKRVAYASSIAAHSFLPGRAWLATLYGAYKLCDEMIAHTYAGTGACRASACARAWCMASGAIRV